MTYKTIDDWLTPPRLAQILKEIGPRGLVYVHEAWRLSADAEREACAAVADNSYHVATSDGACEHIAETIRERGRK